MTALCTGPDCTREAGVRSSGLCRAHYQQRRRGVDLTPIGSTVNPNAGRTCYGPECERIAAARGLCKAHDKQRAKGWELRPINRRIRRTCTYPHCDQEHYARDLCKPHWAMHRRGMMELIPLGSKRAPKPPTLCSFDGCERVTVAKGLCHTHRVQQRRGKPLTPIGAARPGPKPRPERVKATPKPKPTPKPKHARPKRDKPNATLPAGWHKPAQRKKPTAPVVPMREIPYTPPLDPDQCAKVRRLLARRGLLDELADMLGVAA